MTLQRDCATRILLNTIGLDQLSVSPSPELDGDVSYLKTSANHGAIRLSIGGAVVKIYEDGTVSTGPDVTNRTIHSDAKVM